MRAVAWARARQGGAWGGSCCDFSVMSRCTRLNQLVPDKQFCVCSFKKRGNILVTAGKSVCKIQGHYLYERIRPLCLCAQRRRPPVGTLLRVGAQDAVARVFVNSGILVKKEVFISDTALGNDLDVDLDPLARTLHLLVGLGHVLFPGLFLLRQSLAAQHPPQAFHAARVAVASQPGPQLDDAQREVWSIPLLYAGWDAHGVCATGRPATRCCRRSAISSSRCTICPCCIGD